MGIYKTYRGAVIANGSTKGVWVNLNGDEFYTSQSFANKFIPRPARRCNPADYLESVADFHARGKLLTQGDRVIGTYCNVIQLTNEALCEVWNSPSNGHDKRFVLQAAADSEDTDTTWEPVVGDEVSTIEGVGMLLTTVVRDNTISWIVQFENDWNDFKLDELKPVDHEYEAGKTVYELWHSCLPDEPSCSFDMLSWNGQKKWVKFAKLVKPVDA